MTYTDFNDKALLLRLKTDSLNEELSFITSLTEQKLFHYLDKISNWVTTILPSYSKDYAFLEMNWKNISNHLKVQPQKIIIVSYLPESTDDFKDYKILETLCDNLTKFGYIVRHQSQLQGCKSCDKALLTKNVYDYVRKKYNSKGSQLPSNWSEYCSTCSF